MSLNRRGRALERVRKPPGVCEACGIAFHAPMQKRLTFAPFPEDGPDECPSCGRQLLVRIKMVTVGTKEEAEAWSLKRRVRALERVVGPSDRRCEACGYEPGVQPEFKVSMHEEASDGPDVCPKCGRWLIIRLEFERPLEQIEASRKSAG